MDKAKGTEEELEILHKAAKTQEWNTFNKSIQAISGEQHPQANGNAVKIVEDKETSLSAVSMDRVSKRSEVSQENGILPSHNASGQDDEKTNGSIQSLTHHDANETSESCESPTRTKSETNGMLATGTITQDDDEDSFSDLNLDDRWPSTWWEQYMTLTQRSFKHTFSAMLGKIDLVRHVILGAIFGIVYWQLEHSEERLHDIRGVVSRLLRRIGGFCFYY